MKTLDEVKAHVDKVGYNQLAIQKIEGFLLGNGLLGGDFEMEYMIGERDFDDFRDLFNNEHEEEHTPEIDWSEFGFGDFIHVQDGIDVILFGGICNRVFVGYDGENVVPLVLTEKSRPCSEEEIDKVVRRLRNNGIDFCFLKNSFIPSIICNDCNKCQIEEEDDKVVDGLIKDYEELCAIAESMSEDNPCKGMAKAIVEMVGTMVDNVKKSTKNDSSSIDMLEIDAKNAIENVIANIHSGSMNEKERESVVDALKVLVELGKMYE